MNGRYLSAVTLIFVTASFAVAVDSDYDALSARGAQLLHNGSFEEPHREGDFPEGWGVVKPIRKHFKYATSTNDAAHGLRYVAFDLEKQQTYFRGRLDSVPAATVKVTVHARGDGEFAPTLTARRKDWRASKNKWLFREGRKFAVKSDQWKPFTFEYRIEDDYEIDGKRERPKAVSCEIWIKGHVELDACSVVPVDEKQKHGTATKAAAAPAPAPAQAADPKESRPFFTAPRLAQPPVIDGTMASGEWDRAAAVTGFMELNTRKLAERQVTAYMGYDDEYLYVAFHCPHEGVLREGPAEKRDELTNPHQVDGVEIWLVPPDGDWRQFLGWPAGGYLDSSKSQALGWNADLRYASEVVDSGEEIGGILTFRKKIWTAEIAIPFKDVGGSPKPGEEWKINFTRDYSVEPGRTKLFPDWTTWSPIAGRFKSTDEFGSVRFAAGGPVARFEKLGDLDSGDLSVEGGVVGGATRIDARAALENGKTASFRSVTLDAGEATTPFKVEDILKVNMSTPLVYRVVASDPATEAIVAEMTIPFNATAALRGRAIPVFWKNTVFFNIDATRVAGLPDTVTVEATLTRDGTDLPNGTTETWSDGKLEGDLGVSIEGLPPGEYMGTLSIRPNPDADPLVSSVAAFTIPEKPEWVGNKIGVSDAVLPPWKPVEADGATARVTEREYRLGPLGLPEQIVSLEREIFAAPPRLVAVVDGKEQTWRGPAPTVIETTDRRVVWKVAGEAGPLSLQGTLAVEFDGFAQWDFTVDSASPVTLEALRIEFPFHPDRALYARGGKHHALLDPEGPKDEREIMSATYSLGGWIWPNDWNHEMFVGDDRRGLAFMSESDEPVIGDRRFEIDMTAGARTLKVHLVSRPHRLDEPLSYQYFWQGTPVRPKPKDPRVWHASYRNRKLREYIEAGHENMIHTVLNMWSLGHASYPALRSPERRMKEEAAWFQKHGSKVVPYIGTNIFSLDIPSLQPFRPEWEIHPVMISPFPGGTKWAAGCLRNPDMVDYMIWAYRGITLDLGFDGVYLDVSGAFPCHNPYHGCGYEAPDGAGRRSTHPILGNRELYIRMYTLNKSEGRDNVLFRHSMPVAAVAGFVDVVTQGEGWCKEADKQYDRLTPEIFRIFQMKNQYGTPYTWYTFFHYHRGIRHGGRVPLSATLGYCLPHNILPTVGRLGMWPVWKATDPFWTTSEFVPYWSPDAVANVDREGVLASAWLKREEKQALLVVANWNTEPRDVTVTLDLEAIGFAAGRAKVERAVEHPILQPEDPPEGDTMENTPLKLDGARLPLSIHGRNLEILRLTQE